MIGRPEDFPAALRETVMERIEEVMAEAREQGSPLYDVMAEKWARVMIREDADGA